MGLKQLTTVYAVTFIIFKILRATKGFQQIGKTYLRNTTPRLRLGAVVYRRGFIDTFNGKYGVIIVFGNLTLFTGVTQLNVNLVDIMEKNCYHVTTGSQGVVILTTRELYYRFTVVLYGSLQVYYSDDLNNFMLMFTFISSCFITPFWLLVVVSFSCCTS